MAKPKKSKRELREEARLRAENSPIVRQLRELYARGMAEFEARHAEEARRGTSQA